MKKYSPAVGKAIAVYEAALNWLPWAYEQNKTNLYPCTVTRLASCISSEHRYFYTEHHFKCKKIAYVSKYTMFSTYQRHCGL